MNYGFTVTKHGDKTQISTLDYTRIWTKFQSEGLQIVYKYKHEADKTDPHVHYHGLVFSPSGRIRYADFMKEGYSIRFEIPVNLEKWHNYCKHEEKEELAILKASKREDYEKEVYNRVMNSGPIYKQQEIRVKRTTPGTCLFKLVLNI